MRRHTSKTTTNSATDTSRDRKTPAKIEISRTASEGLIKIDPSICQRLWDNDLEQTLIDFCRSSPIPMIVRHLTYHSDLNGICPGRTLAKKTNTYTNLLAIAEQSPSTRFAILSLSASYLKHYATSSQEYIQADPLYMVESIKALTEELHFVEKPDGCLATGMLLVHHDIINDTENPDLCWSCHINMFDVLAHHNLLARSDPALFLKYQLILARTAEPLPHLQLQKRCLATPEPEAHTMDETIDIESKKINSILGLSHQLLSIIAASSDLVSNQEFLSLEDKIPQAAFLLTMIEGLTQWTTDVTGKALEAMIKTAESYRIAAQIYIHCRVLG